MIEFQRKNRCFCFSNFKKNKKNTKIFYEYSSPPLLEPNYNIKTYRRKIMKCKFCGHFTAKHKIKVNEFYKKNYSIISHGKNLMDKFKKIESLRSKSDNFQRVNRFLKYFRNYKKKDMNLLDVGCGLSVFLYELKKKVDWNLTGIEPDINFVRFAKKLNIDVIHSNLKSNIFNKQKFNIISMNKIIEHVKEPARLLKISKKLLSKNGYIYVEVPDGRAASKNKNGKNREEFFVDHLHVFTKESLRKCIKISGFKLLKLESIKEKSGKFTIYAFAKKITLR